jgi:hypothetical protein
VPFLVLSDFGSAISLTSDWSIPFPHEDTDLGGNLALRFLEVLFPFFQRKTWEF